MNISFRQLKVFVEVARLGSMARAAETLHITAPAVSMQIRELENQVGLPLFDRETRRITLSTAGEYFLVCAKRLLAAYKAAEIEMSRFKKLDVGVLTVGMVSTAKYFVPRMLAGFHKEHPGVDVKLVIAPNREGLVALMEDGEIDLAVMGRPPKELSARAEAFAAHPLVFVCPPGHPILQFGHPPVSALAPYSFILREHGSGTRDAMQRFFNEHRFQPRVSMEMSSNEAIKQAVMADMGLSFLSLHTIGLELSAGLLAIVDVEQTPVMRTWFLVHMHSKLLSPTAEAFRYYLLEKGEAFLQAHDAEYFKNRPWLAQ